MLPRILEMQNNWMKITQVYRQWKPTYQNYPNRIHSTLQILLMILFLKSIKKVNIKKTTDINGISPKFLHIALPAIS
jgi:hypothetical protein